MEGNLQMVSLSDIAVSKTNPRTRFDGEAYDALVASIGQKGVLVPVLLRPVETGKKPFEIVFGERRYRASCDIAKKNGGLKIHDIPAIIRGMSDDEAFDAQQIENLQREDLTPLEEAQGFKKYLTGKDDNAVLDLAMRISTSPHRIRRMVAVLGLPEDMLEAWNKGVIAFGVLEQLIRLDNPETQRTLFGKMVNRWFTNVGQLRDEIDRTMLTLEKALFDQTDCASCAKNSACQKSLFGEEISQKTGCMDPKCFMERQEAHISANWETIGAELKAKTPLFKFDRDVPYEERKTMTKLPKQCKECESAVTLVTLDGKLYDKYAVCIGDKKCFKNIHEAPKPAESGEPAKEGEEANRPRVDWHGECFREIFFKDAIPDKWLGVSPTDVKTLRLAVLALMLRDSSIRSNVTSDRFLYRETDLMSFIEVMDVEQLHQILHDSVLSTIMDHDHYVPGVRYQVAKHLGVDLQNDFRITEFYLQKKTSQEIRKLIFMLKFHEDENFMKCISAMGKDVESIGTLKKSQLIHAIMNSGADLAGKVPQEILDIEINAQSKLFKYKKLLDGPAAEGKGGQEGSEKPEEGSEE